VTGDAMRTLRKSLEIRTTDLARELGVTPQTVRSAEIARKLEPKTEAKYTAALGVIARLQTADRRRTATEALLSIAGVDLPDIASISI
jgi:transcriptional regulator with XRE-family HTH domain